MRKGGAMRGLSGKIAIVTGGAMSIGAAIVRAFHAAGVRVTIADIDAEAGAALAVELGEGMHFHRTDIARDDDIARCIEATLERFGGIDFLVNNACTFLDKG